MGADLVTYIAFGPSNIDDSESEIEVAAEDAIDLRDRLVEAAKRLLVDEEDEEALNVFPEPSMASRSVSILLSHAENYSFDSMEELEETDEAIRKDAISEVFNEAGIPRDLAFWDEEKIHDLVQAFVAVWTGNLHYRNYAARPDPEVSDRQVAVAGERTWGDKPKGAYEIFEKAFALQIPSHFGIQ